MVLEVIVIPTERDVRRVHAGTVVRAVPDSAPINQFTQFLHDTNIREAHRLSCGENCYHAFFHAGYRDTLLAYERQHSDAVTINEISVEDAQKMVNDFYAKKPTPRG